MLEPPSIEFSMPPSTLDSSAVSDELQQATYNDESDKPNVIAAVASRLIKGTAAEVNPDDSSEPLAPPLPEDLEANIASSQAYAPHLEADETLASSDESNADGTITELAFHPAFTRGVDSDGVDGEELIRMVLQPKLQSARLCP